MRRNATPPATTDHEQLSQRNDKKKILFVEIRCKVNIENNMVSRLFLCVKLDIIIISYCPLILLIEFEQSKQCDKQVETCFGQSARLCEPTAVTELRCGCSTQRSATFKFVQRKSYMYIVIDADGVCLRSSIFHTIHSSFDPTIMGMSLQIDGTFYLSGVFGCNRCLGHNYFHQFVRESLLFLTQKMVHYEMSKLIFG